MTRFHILIVEDDPDISGPINTFLLKQGYTTAVVTTTGDAEAAIQQGGVDLLLLDVMLPGESGLDLCHRLLGQARPRIIILTALDQPTDKVLGLEFGADDYVAKPFDLRELHARIRAVLRRPEVLQNTPVADHFSSSLCFGEFRFFPFRRHLYAGDGRRILLTTSEADMLLLFCQHPREVLSRDELMGVPGDEVSGVSGRAIDLRVSRLRRKLSGNDPLKDVIHTVRSDGYVLQADVVST